MARNCSCTRAPLCSALLRAHAAVSVRFWGHLKLRVHGGAGGLAAGCSFYVGDMWALVQLTCNSRGAGHSTLAAETPLIYSPLGASSRSSRSRSRSRSSSSSSSSSSLETPCTIQPRQRQGGGGLHIITRDVLEEVEGVLAVEAAGKADAEARAAAAALGKADADARILQLQQEVAAAGEVVFSFFISLLLVFVFIVLQSHMRVICWEAGG
jgi:hypothetical protein